MLLNNQESLGVRPEVFKPVELALLGGHQMYEDAGEVDDNPPAVRRTFPAGGVNLVILFQILLDRLGRGAKLPNVVDRCDDEEVRDR